MASEAKLRRRRFNFMFFCTLYEDVACLMKSRSKRLFLLDDGQKLERLFKVVGLPIIFLKPGIERSQSSLWKRCFVLLFCFTFINASP